MPFIQEKRVIEFYCNFLTDLEKAVTLLKRINRDKSWVFCYKPIVCVEIDMCVDAA